MKSTHRKTALLVLIAVAAVGWLALFLTTHGILIGSTTATTGHGRPVLKCNYFTGVSVVTIDFWLAHQLGCPRLYDLGATTNCESGGHPENRCE